MTGKKQYIDVECLCGSLIIYAQIAIIAAGNQTETIGEVFPIMQQDLKQKEISLSVPTYTIEQPKPIAVKKKTWLEKLILTIKNLFR